MQEGWLLLVLVLAVACGWLLGRWQRSRSRGADKKQLPEAYYRGLNYLLNEQPEQAMDMFMQALDDDSGAIDTHLALGKLFRARGDFSKATRVHQNLLARPDFDSAQQLLVQFELASDYMAAGLFDRAERLLNELLIASSTGIRKKSLLLLLELYQREKEWLQAISTAEALLAMQDDSVTPMIAQYLCEVAEQHFKKGDEVEVRFVLKKALSHDRGCIRAYLLLAKIDVETQQYRDAIKTLKQIKKQDVGYLAESMPALQNCYQKLGQEKNFHAYLLECLHDGSLIPSGFNGSQAMRKLTAKPEQLSLSVNKEARQSPSLHGLRYLIDFQMYDAQGADIDYLQNLREFVDQLIEVHLAYRCRHCGYKGKHLTWLCPSCQHWGTIRSSHTIE
jgi:lipopolysaccharide assembly protein B